MIRGKIVPERSFVSTKKHVCIPNFLTKPPSHVFFGQNGLFAAFWGKTISHKNFPPFCLLSPQNHFFEKHVSGQNFFTKPTTITIGAKRTIWHNWGQNCSGVKFCVFEKASLRSEFFD
jgi:hypothetical protein